MPLSMVTLSPTQDQRIDHDVWKRVCNLAQDNPSLLQLIPKLHVLSREFTGVGSAVSIWEVGIKASLGKLQAIDRMLIA